MILWMALLVECWHVAYSYKPKLCMLFKKNYLYYFFKRKTEGKSIFQMPEMCIDNIDVDCFDHEYKHQSSRFQETQTV